MSTSNDAATISVVIPTFNAEKHLECALDSVARQSFPAIEAIVADDFSTDDTVAIAHRHPTVSCVIKRTQRGGPGAARNDGVARARGTYIAFLDADDYWADDKLERQAMALKGRPEFSMATCVISEFHDSALTETEKAAMPLRCVPAAIPSTILIDKSVFQKVGGFVADGGTGSESLEWGLAISEAGVKILPVPEAIAYRRLHSSNTSRVSRASQHHGYLSALKASLDRRRKTEG